MLSIDGRTCGNLQRIQGCCILLWHYGLHALCARTAGSQRASLHTLSACHTRSWPKPTVDWRRPGLQSRECAHLALLVADEAQHELLRCGRHRLQVTGGQLLRLHHEAFKSSPLLISQDFRQLCRQKRSHGKSRPAHSCSLDDCFRHKSRGMVNSHAAENYVSAPSGRVCTLIWTHMARSLLQGHSTSLQHAPGLFRAALGRPFSGARPAPRQRT